MTLENNKNGRKSLHSGGATDVRHAVFKGASWLVILKFLTKVVDAVVLFVLARMLSPADFGLVALAMGFILITEAMLELPVASAILRLSIIKADHFDTAFTLSLLRGLVFLLLSGFLTYPISVFTNEPRIIPLIFVLSIAPIVRGLSSPYMILFVKTLDFRREFAVEIIGKMSGAGAAIWVAYSYRSYWAMVVATITGPFVGTILTYVLAPYRPRLTLSQWQIFSQFIGWGAITQCLVAISWQCDRFFLGRFVSKSDLGQFSISSDLTNIPYQSLVIPILRPLNTIIYNRSDDHDSLRRAYVQAVATISMIGIPSYSGLFVIAKILVIVFLGKEWSQAGDVAGIISLSFLPGMLVLPWPAVAIANAKPHLITLSASIEFFVRIPIVFITVSYFGVIGASWARLGLNVFIVAVAFVFVRYLLELSYRAQFQIVWRPIISSVAMCLIIYPLSLYLDQKWGGVIMMGAVLIILLLGVLSYSLFIFFFWAISGYPKGPESLIARYIRNFLS